MRKYNYPTVDKLDQDLLETWRFRAYPTTSPHLMRYTDPQTGKRRRFRLEREIAVRMGICPCRTDRAYLIDAGTKAEPSNNFRRSNITSSWLERQKRTRPVVDSDDADILRTALTYQAAGQVSDLHKWVSRHVAERMQAPVHLHPRDKVEFVDHNPRNCRKENLRIVRFSLAVD